MNSTEARNQLRDALSAFGSIGVRRYTGFGASRVAVTPDATALARVRSYQAAEIVGGLVIGDRQVIVLVEAGSALAGMLPLSDNTDRLVIAGREVAIKSCNQDTRCLNGDVFGLDIVAAG